VSRHPLLLPALGLTVGIAVGLSGRAFPPAALAALPLAISAPLSPAAFSAAGWWASGRARVIPVSPPPGMIELHGRVVTAPDRLGDRVRFRLRTPAGDLLDATADPPAWPLALGDEVRFRAGLRVPPGARNPGGRDLAWRLRAGGVALQAIASGPVVRVAAPSPAAWLERARERLAEVADRTLPSREAAVVRAIGCGDRAALDPATSTSFARSGLAHVLAVSGFHLVVVIFGLVAIVRGLLVRVDAIATRIDPRRLAALLVLPLALIYALATGAGPPVLRGVGGAAGILGGALLDRDVEPLNGLGLAALLLLAADPASAADPSLQLSFAAVAGLALWARSLRRALPVAVPPPGTWRARLVEPFLAGCCATAAASIATAPILALHFRQLPLLGLVANVAGIPIGSALTALSAVAAIAAAIAPALATLILLPCWPLATGLLALSDAAAAPRWGVLGVGSPGVAGALLAWALAVGAGRLRGAPRLLTWIAAVACVALPGPLRAAAARTRGGLEVLYVSVGQGDAALLRLPDGSAVLVDAGGAPDGGPDPGARDVVPLLRDLGVRRLAAVFVSHPHPDHVLGLAAVADAFSIERVFSNGDRGDGEARQVVARLAPVELRPGESWERAGVRFEARGGDRAPLAANDASLVLRVVYGGTAFLFPGDVEGAGEAVAVAAGGLRADAVKVPHHGSRRSSTAPFAAAVSPRWAIASVGAANRYGFPHDEAVARWRAVGASVVRTDEGAIRLLSDGRTVRRVPAGTVLDPVATWRERP
jgi:competence protein ComEC